MKAIDLPVFLTVTTVPVAPFAARASRVVLASESIVSNPAVVGPSIFFGPVYLLVERQYTVESISLPFSRSASLMKWIGVSSAGSSSAKRSVQVSAGALADTFFSAILREEKS